MSKTVTELEKKVELLERDVDDKDHQIRALLLSVEEKELEIERLMFREKSEEEEDDDDDLEVAPTPNALLRIDQQVETK